MTAQGRERRRMDDWDTTARTLWALGVGCFITAVGYALQSLVTDIPPAPEFGRYGCAFMAALIVYDWSVTRAKQRGGKR